jgi:hypothetical protein
MRLLEQQLLLKDIADSILMATTDRQRIALVTADLHRHGLLCNGCLKARTAEKAVTAEALMDGCTCEQLPVVQAIAHWDWLQSSRKGRK